MGNYLKHVLEERQMIQMKNKYMEFLAFRMVHFYLLAKEPNPTQPPSKEEFDAYNIEFGKRRELQKEMILFILKSLDKDLCEKLIHGLHRIAKKHEPEVEKGEYKKAENFVFNIFGEYDTTAQPEEVPDLMNAWINKQNELIEKEMTEDEFIKSICQAVIEFFEIHPYRNGNGNVGRALMLFLSLKKGLYPIVIPKQQRERYANCVAKRDVEDFSKMIKENLEKEEQIWKEMNGFSK